MCLTRRRCPMAPTDPETDAVAEALRKRGDCLAALVATPRSKRDLGEALEMPRSTLDRAVRELEDAGLIETDGGGYRATALGHVASRVHAEYRSALADACAAADVLADLPPETPLGREFLEDAAVSESAPFAPDGVVDELFASVADADHVRGVAPVALTGHTDEFHERALAGGGRLTLVLSSAVVETLRETDSWEDNLQADGMTVSEADVPFSFGLWLTDAEAGVVVYTDTGIRAVLRNDTDAALAWAEAQYDRVARTATPLGPGTAEHPPGSAD